VIRAWLYDQAAWRHNRLHLALVLVLVVAGFATVTMRGLIIALIAAASVVGRVWWWESRRAAH
jgi:hypothetical protein